VVRPRPWDADRAEQLPTAVRIAKLDALQAFDDVDRLGAVGREVEGSRSALSVSQSLG